MTQNAEQSFMLAQPEPGHLEVRLAILETGSQQIITNQQNIRLAMDALHGMVKFSVYLGERFTDFVLFVERLSLYPERLSAEQTRRIVHRIELMGQRLDEIELRTAVKVINLL